MKGIVKLFPVHEKHIVTGCIVKFNTNLYTVKEVLNENLRLNNDDIVSKKQCQLMKYYITTKRNIIGEVNFIQYPYINDGEEYEFSTRSINTRMNVGNLVVLYKPLLHNLGKYDCKSVKGVITEINNRTATIQTLDGCITNIKRHRLRLLDLPDKKLICTLKI